MLIEFEYCGQACSHFAFQVTSRVQLNENIFDWKQVFREF